MPKRATAKEVALHAGVSRTTVSFVLNNVPGVRISAETRLRVLEAARQLDYHPDAMARNMASGRTGLIGFVLRQTPDQVFADRMLPQLLAGITQAAADRGFHILFEPVRPDDRSGAYARLIRERQVDGILLADPRLDDQELEKIHATGAPLVLIGRLPQSGIPHVEVNAVHAARLATEHLVRLGHRRIGLVTHAPPVYASCLDRMAGYREALEAAGIAYDEALIRHGDFTPQSGEAAMAELLRLNPRPTAVFVASDTVALGGLRMIRLSGLRVPEELALVGFDDIPLAEFVDPPLTTVRQPVAALGWGAAELLIRRIAGEAVGETELVLNAELVVRRSCGADGGQGTR